MVSLHRIDEGISRSGVIQAPREQALFGELHAAIEFYHYAPDALIQVLHRAQELFGYLRDDVVRYISIELRVPLSKVWGVIGFYSFFSRIPQGKFQVNVCMGTACYVRGADQLVRAFENQLKIKMNETTPDGRFSLKCIRCLGACGLAPVAMVGKDVHSKLKTDQIKKVLKAYK